MKYYITLLGLLALVYCAKPLPVSEVKLLKLDASSTLSDKKDFYNVKNINDNTKLNWCEGKQDDGIGESITYTYEKEVLVESIYIKNGFGEKKFFPMNNRVKKLKIETEKKESIEINLEDTNSQKEIKLATPLKGKIFTFTILSVYPGTNFKDTCITELSFTKQNIPDFPGSQFCEIEFKNLTMQADTDELHAEIELNSETGIHTGFVNVKNFHQCDKPSYELKVDYTSSLQGKEFSITSSYDYTSPNEDCAGQIFRRSGSFDAALFKCDDGSGNTIWEKGSLICKKNQQGSSLKLECEIPH